MARDRPSLHGPKERSGKGGAIVLLIVVVLIGVLVYFLFFNSQPQVSKATGLLSQAEVAVKAAGKESFTFEGSIETQTAGKLAGIPVSGEGRMDITNKRMYFKINFESPITAPGGKSNGSVTVESYVIGDEVYINVDGTWGKYQSAGGLWGDVLFSEKMIEFAKGFDSTVAGTEKVSGKNAYKVVITPTIQDLVAFVSSLDTGIAQGISGVDLTNIDKGIKSISMTMWIDTSSYLPIQLQGLIEAETNAVNPTGVGAVKQDVTMSLTANFDYNTPFNIVLPSAAQSAQEILPAQ